MKHLLAFTIALAISFVAFSQHTGREMGRKISNGTPKNEVKLNLATSIFSYPEVSYERVLNADFSIGGSLGGRMDLGLSPYDYIVDYALTPYLRYFFGGESKKPQKYASGFFFELNSAVVAGQYASDHSNGYIGGNDVIFSTGAGLGLAIGWKFVTKYNWTGEIFLGRGRDFVRGRPYPRFGISVGKRF